jgi:hypothetical protein
MEKNYERFAFNHLLHKRNITVPLALRCLEVRSCKQLKLKGFFFLALSEEGQ